MLSQIWLDVTVFLGEEPLSAAAFQEENGGTEGGGISSPCVMVTLEDAMGTWGSSVYQADSPQSSSPIGQREDIEKWEMWGRLLGTWPWRKELKGVEDTQMNKVGSTQKRSEN